MPLNAIATQLAPHGLIVRGGFYPDPADVVPGDPATLVIIGNAGPGMWRAFECARGDGPDPLDAWTRGVISGVAEKVGAVALFPFDGPPYMPFQKWAMRADGVFESPIGPLVHPEYGLWHGYRGALAFDHKIELPPPAAAVSPCETCADKPCLTSCPADAFSPAGYDVPACVEGLGPDCLERGCLARRACPVGREFIQQPAQAAFHMKYFVASHG
ncbi:MAG: 4Fe-4S dicluster domain-containing protein [Rhodospirillales bacterium]|nr:4Fe-4S dicluster domain-containing protein [Rhodospirillales bacterium]